MVSNACPASFKERDFSLLEVNMFRKIKQFILGKPRDLRDPQVYHKVSLIAFLAWVGLGADGLSSSCYGPDEAFRALGSHAHLAILLVIMTAVTIFVISIAYSNLIQHFPGGGGGYLVATKLLGARAGVVSGCALLVDYVLTISVSIASGCDALWSFLPSAYLPYKLPGAFAALIVLMILNLRGVKESVTVLAPIFMSFIATHLFLIVYAMGSRFSQLPAVFHGAATDFHASVSSFGFVPVLLILLKAYSMGGGTYTGIEAVSNGVSMLREPKVQTGKRTMFLMATSLAITAGGILFGYLLTDSQPVPGKTMNAVLLENLFGSWGQFGAWIIILTLISEAVLLLVAAQAGFLDGPRVLANMALDSWVPHRFSQLSDRLVSKNGIYLMGLAAMATLLYTQGNITTLVVMYSINVFVTFSMTELGMSRYWIKHRAEEPRWKSQLAIHGTGLVMCVSILAVILFEKFADGGWITIGITGAVIGFCFWVKRHYRNVAQQMSRLDQILESVPLPEKPFPPSADMDRNAPTAILTVSTFSGYGLHHILSIQKNFSNYYKNFIFVSVGVVDSGNFKGVAEIDRLEASVRESLGKYVSWCRQQGLNADYRMAVDTESINAVQKICQGLSEEFPKSVVFTGNLLFQKENWFSRLLHNETSYAIQRRLQFQGINAMILPIRVV